jgi:ABC-2 type transport system ATP-binding protein
VAELEVRNLTKRYGSTVAVDDLSFEVHAGRVTGFLGPNGAGKTTTMRALLGLLRPTRGEALVDGQPPVRMREPLRTIGAALEATAFHPGRSGRAHLRVLASAARIPMSRVEEVLELVELSGAAGRRVGGYSLGMRQRLALAAALLGEPRTLILDEPANGLDPQGMRWLRDLLRAQAAEGRTVLVSSHVLSEVAQTADELILIRGGKLVSQTTLAEFTAAEASAVRVRAARLDELAGGLVERRATVSRDEGGALLVTGASAEEIGELALGMGIALHELAPQRSSLEERFLEVMGEEDEGSETAPGEKEAGA